MNIASIVLVGLVAGLAQFSHAGKIFQSFSRFCFINYHKNSFQKNTAVYLSSLHKFSPKSSSSKFLHSQNKVLSQNEEEKGFKRALVQHIVYTDQSSLNLKQWHFTK
jgi:hypothetical protein